ncbi:unnamed protein product [Adineta steineri]|uniref:Calcium release-activated calcium channel protein 1 n=1 Tax=Adineta steineri TaxID=433720 RepID=A0A816D1G0_9BILA|nr:unnamed protein product [Adineta steineri]CAF1632313.1 unnamed protein product [Adineta steineri]
MHKKHLLKQRRLQLSKAKLRAVSRTSALLSGFALIAMVEVSLDDHKQPNGSIPLIIVYSILTCLVVGVHLLALMISTCLLPLLEAESFLHYKEHETIYVYVEFTWLLSTGFGIFLFLLEMTIICWVKFFFITQRAAIATTIVFLPIFILFCTFLLTFHRRLVILKLSQHQNELDQIEKNWTTVHLPLVNVI